MKKHLCLEICISLLIFSCVSLAGCGGTSVHGDSNATDNRTTSGSAVSGSAVSGGAVSGSAVDNSDTRSETGVHRFATDTSFYMTAYKGGKKDELVNEFDEDSTDDEIIGIQYCPKDDLTKNKIIKIPSFGGLLTVTEDDVYYLKTDKTVWRMPIEKDEEGADVLKPEREEKLLKEKEGIIRDQGVFTIDSGSGRDSAIVYNTYKGHVKKYDWKAGKETVHKIEGNIARITPVSRDCFIVGNMYGGFFRWDIKTDKWTQFSDYEEAGQEAQAMGTDSFFYAAQDDETGAETVFRYGMGTKETETFLSEQQLSQACESYVGEQGGELIYYNLVHMFFYGEKLYVQMQADWKKENQYRMNYVIFCVDEKGKTPLCPAREWMDFLAENSEDERIQEKLEGCEEVRYNASQILHLIDGKLIVVLSGGESVCPGCYDLEKKSGGRISKGVPEYYMPYYDTDSEAYPEYVLDGGMGIVPEELLDYWGC